MHPVLEENDDVPSTSAKDRSEIRTAGRSAWHAHYGCNALHCIIVARRRRQLWLSCMSASRGGP